MNGKTASLRRTIRLAPGYQLQRDPSGSGHTLLSPKGPIQLNESAAMILDLCNGTYASEKRRVARLQLSAQTQDGAAVISSGLSSRSRAVIAWAFAPAVAP